MPRILVAAAFLVAVGAAARADDGDAVKEKLFAAKVAYDKEMAEYRKAAEEWFAKREDDARKDGNKKLVDQIKAEREAFDEAGVLPRAVPGVIPQKQLGAQKALEAAYGLAIRDYVKAKRDAEAAAVEAEWRGLAAKVNALDLLARVDPKVHAVFGEWKRDGKALVGSSGDKPAILQLPFEPGEEYDLEVVCRRVSGTEGLCVGLVAGGRQVAAVFDGWPTEGYLSGLDRVDRKAAKDNVTAIKGELLKAGADHTTTCSVRGGRIDLSVNGKAVTSFKGAFTRLSLAEGWGGPNKRALFLHFLGAFQFDRIAVTPVKGGGTVLK